MKASTGEKKHLHLGYEKENFRFGKLLHYNFLFSNIVTVTRGGRDAETSASLPPCPHSYDLVDYNIRLTCETVCRPTSSDSMLQKVMLDTFSWSVLKSRLREMLSMSAAAAITSAVVKRCQYTNVVPVHSSMNVCSY